MDKTVESRCDLLREAASHLRSALECLDRGRAPAQIGAHVDLAAFQLERELSGRLSPSLEPPAGKYGHSLQ